MAHMNPPAPVATPAGPPDWNEVTIDLLCPRCGYNLRMLTGNRCPECGLELEWAQIIAAAEGRLACPLFEYQWRKWPIRSFFGTLRLSIHPRQLWTTTPLAAEVRITPNLVMLLLLSAVGVVLSACNEGANALWLSWWLRGSLRPGWPYRVWQIVLVKASLSSEEFVVLLVHGLLIWSALQLFAQSFLHCGIRRSQSLRVATLIWMAIICWKVPASIFQSWLEAAYFVWFRTSRPFHEVSIACDCIAVATAVFSSYLASKVYLRLDHPLAVAVVVTLLAFLTWTTVAFVHALAVDDWDNTLNARTAGAWPGLNWLLYYWRVLFD